MPVALLLLGGMLANVAANPHIWHDFRPSFYPVLPKWEPTWDVGQSTIIQPCHSAGLMPVDTTKGWGLVSFDWSNAKEQWSQAGGAPRPTGLPCPRRGARVGETNNHSSATTRRPPPSTARRCWTRRPPRTTRPTRTSACGCTGTPSWGCRGSAPCAKSSTTHGTQAGLVWRGCGRERPPRG